MWSRANEFEQQLQLWKIEGVQWLVRSLRRAQEKEARGDSAGMLPSAQLFEAVRVVSEDLVRAHCHALADAGLSLIARLDSLTEDSAQWLKTECELHARGIAGGLFRSSLERLAKLPGMTETSGVASGDQFADELVNSVSLRIAKALGEARHGAQGADPAPAMVPTPLEQLRQQLLRVIAVLETACIPHTVMAPTMGGGFVNEVLLNRAGSEALLERDGSLVLLLRREQRDLAAAALASDGFAITTYCGHLLVRTAGLPVQCSVAVVPGLHWLDLHWHVKPTPNLMVVAEVTPALRLVRLESLVRTKLMSVQDRDGVQLRDLVHLGVLDATLLDATGLARLPADLASRLREILDNPH